MARPREHDHQSPRDHVLTGRVAIVTGGNRGIGYATAEGLAAHGALVVIANRDGVEGAKVAGSLCERGMVAEAIGRT